VTNPAGLFGSDFVTWSQSGSYVSQTFYAMSSDGGDFVTGHLSNGAAQTVSACSSCAFKAIGGIAANDDLLLTSQFGTNSAPLSFSLSNPVYGAGAYIEAANGGKDANTTFTIQIQAFYGVNSVLTSTALVTSDSAGDPIFVGVTDSKAEINKVVFTLTDARGNPISESFAIDKLYLQDAAPGSQTQTVQTVQTLQTIPTAQFQPVQTQPLLLGPDPSGVPEPSVTLLVGPALLALIFGIRRRAARG